MPSSLSNCLVVDTITSASFSALSVLVYHDTNLLMFPNPTDGQLTINLNEPEIEEIRVYDQMAVLLSVYELKELINSLLDRSNLASNLYTVFAKTKDQTISIG
jgi:hypothetical protein